MQGQSSYYVKNREALWRRIGDRAVIICVDKIYNLKNESAVFLWESIDGKTSFTGLVDNLKEEFDITQEQAQQDAEEFILALNNLDLIKEGEKHEKTDA